LAARLRRHIADQRVRKTRRSSRCDMCDMSDVDGLLRRWLVAQVWPKQRS